MLVLAGLLGAFAVVALLLGWMLRRERHENARLAKELVAGEQARAHQRNRRVLERRCLPELAAAARQLLPETAHHPTAPQIPREEAERLVRGFLQELETP
jgi:hypothetical protein